MKMQNPRKIVTLLVCFNTIFIFKFKNLFNSSVVQKKIPVEKELLAHALSCIHELSSITFFGQKSPKITKNSDFLAIFGAFQVSEQKYDYIFLTSRKNVIRTCTYLIEVSLCCSIVKSQNSVAVEKYARDRELVSRAARS